MQRNTRRDIGGIVWHGAWLAAGQALAEPVSVLPALIFALTGSAVWVGGLSALLAVAGALPQVPVARYVEPMRRKKALLLTAIAVRAGAWGGLGIALAWAGADRPKMALAALVLSLTFFAGTGAIGAVPYVDLIGRVLPADRRGAALAARENAGALLGIGATVLSTWLLTWSFPNNFAALFALSAFFLAVASLGIAIIPEPIATPPAQLPWREFAASLRTPAKDLLPLSSIFWMSGISALALPLYVVAARRAGAPEAALPWFIGASVLGALVANTLWARLVDRYGAWRMLQVCAALAILAPLGALWSLHTDWRGLVLVLALAGASQGGRRVGFSAALLERAPAARRPTYGATWALMGMPVASFPLLGGVIAQYTSYDVLFGATALGLLAALVWMSTLGKRIALRPAN